MATEIGLISTSEKKNIFFGRDLILQARPDRPSRVICPSGSDRERVNLKNH
jgi:hypothetical protein